MLLTGASGPRAFRHAGAGTAEEAVDAPIQASDGGGVLLPGATCG